MEQTEFDKLLLNTAFCCMASDGAIDPKEIAQIKKVFSSYKLYSEINIEEKLNSFIKILNQKGKSFFNHYFEMLDSANLSEQQELALIEIAIQTINADEIIEYAEIKFFKVIRHNLKISDEQILAAHPDIEMYLEEDIITESYMDKIINQYLDNTEFPEFELIPK
jgi:uncharacterized tellurite resistance protein B-like protein